MKGRKPGNFESVSDLRHGFVRRENTYHLALLYIQRLAIKRGNGELESIVEYVMEHANDGDSIKLA